MERESFEDQEVADILNRHFVSVKVDREERPDIDHMYMTYCQVLTGAGGWPLTVIMTADKQPFFAGTYFPKRSQYGRPGIMDVLNQIAETWQKDRNKVLEAADELYGVVREHYEQKHRTKDDNLKNTGTGFEISVGRQQEDDISVWGKVAIRRCYDLMEKNFDTKFGGFGNAPKFPTPHQYGFLMRYALKEPQSRALAMVEKTFDSMADGGIYDHIGFGFARYSTDRYWLVPHFEKMLYDNAGLAYYYLEAFQLTQNPCYARIAQEIFTYVLRDMTSPEGGFYSAEDADSEGVEGKYYVWDELHIKMILSDAVQNHKAGQVSNQSTGRKLFDRYLDQAEVLGDIYCEAFGINEEGNYEGRNIPSKIFSIWEGIAFRHKMTLAQLEQLMAYCNEILFAERNKRIHPAKDDKILVSWNGLMIAALAKGAQVFSQQSFRHIREHYLLAAENAVEFIFTKMINAQGRLLARYREREADFAAYLDDYAFMVYALLELYTATGKTDYLARAVHLQQEQERLFHDEVHGGYYFTGHDAEELLIRPKEIYDGAMPSGNSVSAYNLLRLWKITGDDKWLKLAKDQINTFKDTLIEYPPGYTAFLLAVQFLVSNGEELVLAGAPGSPLLNDMQAVFFEQYRPFSVVAYQDGTVKGYAPKLESYPATMNAQAYLCRDFTCREPVDTPESLRALLLS